jgi:hypothetical protein
VTGSSKQLRQFLNLSGSRRWTCLLSECHLRSLPDGCPTHSDARRTDCAEREDRGRVATCAEPRSSWPRITWSPTKRARRGCVRPDRPGDASSRGASAGSC